MAKIGYRIELRDAANGQRLTFCSQGTTCSTALVEPSAGTRTIAAALVAQSPASHAGAIAVSPSSNAVSGTWLGVQLATNAISGVGGGVVSLTATANADLSQTPWSIYIQNEAGQQIGSPCNASTCSADLMSGSSVTATCRPPTASRIECGGSISPANS